MNHDASFPRASHRCCLKEQSLCRLQANDELDYMKTLSITIILIHNVILKLKGGS
jgi:hypothetical protein